MWQGELVGDPPSNPKRGKLEESFRWDAVPFSSSVTAMDLIPHCLTVYVVLQTACGSENFLYTVQW